MQVHAHQRRRHDARDETGGAPTRETAQTRLGKEEPLQHRHERFGCCTMNDYVALVLGVDDVASRERMRVSRALGELTRLEETLKNGQLSYAKVRAVTRVATVENEQEWINKALELLESKKLRMSFGVTTKTIRKDNDYSDEHLTELIDAKLSKTIAAGL